MYREIKTQSELVNKYSKVQTAIYCKNWPQVKNHPNALELWASNFCRFLKNCQKLLTKKIKLACKKTALGIKVPIWNSFHKNWKMKQTKHFFKLKFNETNEKQNKTESALTLIQLNFFLVSSKAEFQGFFRNPCDTNGRCIKSWKTLEKKQLFTTSNSCFFKIAQHIK